MSWVTSRPLLVRLIDQIERGQPLYGHAMDYSTALREAIGLADNAVPLSSLATRIDANHSVVASKLDSILCFLKSEGEKSMAQIDDIKASIAAETTVIGSVVKLLQQLSGLIATAASPADLAAIKAMIDANNKALADAVVANTPAAPPTPPAP